MRVDGLAHVTAIDGGVNFSVALTSDGTVWVWGSNTDGNLGTTVSVSSGPIAVAKASAATALAPGPSTTYVPGIT